MMKVHFEKDFGREMEAFTIFLQQRPENQDNCGLNNELLRKFAMFLEMEKRGPSMCGKLDHHGGKHNGFGKHGHHGHHFGKHGFGRHGHNFGRHWHGFRKHGPGFARHHHEFGRHGHGCGRHDHDDGINKNFLRKIAEALQSVDETNQQSTINGCNPSPPQQEAANDIQGDKEQCIGHLQRLHGDCFRHHSSGRRGRCNANKMVSTQTEDCDALENVETIEDNITIEDSSAAN